jgi:hypothetical protein
MMTSCGGLCRIRQCLTYAKSDKEDLTDAEKREVRRLVAALEAEA